MHACQVSVEYAYPTDSEIFKFDIFFWTCTTLTVVIGVPLGVGIVHYEWYGGDSQKRSLVNRFSSWGLITQLIAFTTVETFVGFLR